MRAGSVGSVVLQCWPVLGALFFSGTFFVLAFPFFTYVPSGGTFGQDLPKVTPHTHNFSHSTSVKYWQLKLPYVFNLLCLYSSASNGDLLS